MTKSPYTVLLVLYLLFSLTYKLITLVVRFVLTKKDVQLKVFPTINEFENRIFSKSCPRYLTLITRKVTKVRYITTFVSPTFVNCNTNTPLRWKPTY